MVSDWYIGQWAWFIAFAGWSCLLSLLGDEYIDVYGSTTAWWLLDAAILLACKELDKPRSIRNPHL